MMDCKKALVEADGDMERAIELLRKKGQKVAENRIGRDAKEGAILIKTSEDNTTAVMIELNCETDFVAGNADFKALGNDILTLAEAQRPADVEGLKALKMADGRTITEHLVDAMGKIGEKIDVREYKLIVAEAVVPYIHTGSRVGVVICFSNVNGKDVIKVGKDVAMQVASMKPKALDKDDVPAEIVKKEMEIAVDLMKQDVKNANKPQAILEKIAAGKLDKFFKDNTLLNQEFVKDSSKSVAQYVKDSLGDTRVSAFHHMILG
jgi:elongation factor Ts